MKSLEIVNRVIQSYQKCFVIGSLEEADKLSCLEMVKIKQDLEVLEKENLANLMLDVAEEFLKDIFKDIEVNKETKEDMQIIANVVSEFGSRVIDKIQSKTMVGG